MLLVSVVLGCLALDPSRLSSLPQKEPVFKCCTYKYNQRERPGLEEGVCPEAYWKPVCYPSVLLGIYAILIIPTAIFAFLDILLFCVIDLDKWKKWVGVAYRILNSYAYLICGSGCRTGCSFTRCRGWCYSLPF